MISFFRFSLKLRSFLSLFFFRFSIICRRVFNKTIILLGLAGYEMIITNSALRALCLKIDFKIIYTSIYSPMPIGFTSSCTDTVSPRSCTLDCTLVFVCGTHVWHTCVVRARVYARHDPGTCKNEMQREKWYISCLLLLCIRM